MADRLRAAQPSRPLSLSLSFSLARSLSHLLCAAKEAPLNPESHDRLVCCPEPLSPETETLKLKPNTRNPGAESRNPTEAPLNPDSHDRQVASRSILASSLSFYLALSFTHSLSLSCSPSLYKWTTLSRSRSWAQIFSNPPEAGWGLPHSRSRKAGGGAHRGGGPIDGQRGTGASAAHSENSRSREAGGGRTAGAPLLVSHQLAVCPN